MNIIRILILLSFIAFCSAERLKTFTKKWVQETPDWWKTAVFYQIYPRSFKDSNNDGIGDLQGIIQKLDHFVDTGITGIWLSPIFKSPQVDQGYDISDYRDVDPIFGTLDDLKELIEKAHRFGIKIIFDFVPNHTSDEHQWFKDSVARKEGYEDYYIWSDGIVTETGERKPPNNWISVFKGSAWTWNEERQQYYFHQFESTQPDLNLRNEKVLTEMKDILEYWLDFGVDGFRVDAAIQLLEDADLRDEPVANNSGASPNDFEYLDHIYTKDLDETFDLIYKWREFLDNYTTKHGGDTRIMMLEAYTSLEQGLLFYRSEDCTKQGAHFSFNFDFILFNKKSTAQDFSNVVIHWVFNAAVIYNWVFGNHDNHRIATRFGPEKVDGINMIASILPGVQITYNGEEIGQEDGEVICEEGQDPRAIKNCSIFSRYSRDFSRTPFQWDNSINAGFNDGAKPWLPVSVKANKLNLAAQLGDNPKTHFNIYKQLLKLKASFPKTGITEIIITYSDNNVLQFGRRFYNDTHIETYTMVFNLSDDLQETRPGDVFGIGEVVIVSSNSMYDAGDLVNLSQRLLLLPYESIIIRTTETYDEIYSFENFL